MDWDRTDSSVDCIRFYHYPSILVDIYRWLGDSRRHIEQTLRIDKAMHILH